MSDEGKKASELILEAVALTLSIEYIGSQLEQEPSDDCSISTAGGGLAAVARAISAKLKQAVEELDTLIGQKLDAPPVAAEQAQE